MAFTPGSGKNRMLSWYGKCIGPVRRNRLLPRVLFGVRPAVEADAYWDWTTLILKRALRKYMRNAHDLLDVGTGAAGVLAIHGKKRFPHAQVYGLDQFRTLVISARNTAQRNSADVHFLAADLLCAISHRFDCIVFNAPYIDDAMCRTMGMQPGFMMHRMCSGGPDGLRTIDRFLHMAAKALTDNGKILLGINGFYLSSGRVEARLQEHGLRLVERMDNRLTRSYALVLGRGDA